MGNWDNYKAEERPRLGAGDHRCVIVNAEEATSKTSGNPMIVVTVQPNGAKMNIKTYFVKNEYFNSNITEFFDAFNIERGDFNMLTWVGCMGAARFVEDENGYLKVKFFIHPQKAENLPAWIGDKPERQTVTEAFASASDEELPF